MMNTIGRLFSLAGVLTALVATAAVASAGAGTNGDTLSGEFDGGSTGPTTFHTRGPIVGGTGRFAGAEGTLTFDGVVIAQTASSATVHNTITGTISTVGSSVGSS